jgi:predicted amidohydrolase
MTGARTIPAPPIAVAQTVAVRGDLDANLEQHLRLAHVAADGGAGVLVFPELSLTGYELDLAEGLALAADDRRLDPLVEVASSRSITLVAGAPLRVASRLHIGGFIIAPGRPVELHTKRHLGAFPAGARVDGVVPPAESAVFQPGDRQPLVRVGGSLAAVAICAEVGRPAHARRAAERGAGVYLASMFVIRSELERETATLRAHAATHSMVVAFANHGGPTGGLAAAGRSAIWSASGELLVRLGPRGPGVAIAGPADDGTWRGRPISVEAD